MRRLDDESSQSATQSFTLWQALASPTMLILIAGYLLIGFGVYSKNFFLPLMIKTMGYNDQTVGYLSALPNLCGVFGMILFSRHSDRTGERVWHVALPCLLAAAGLLGAGLTLAVNPIVAMSLLLPRRVRHLGLVAMLLEPAHGMAGSGRGGRRNRCNQFGRQHFRICRAADGRRAARCHRQL